jgi:hypothetical protein
MSVEIRVGEWLVGTGQNKVKKLLKCVMQTTPDPSGYPDVRKVGLGSARL